MEHPVARVAVDLPLANLDRPFDYAVPPELDADAQPGVRVKVRFAGRLRDGFVLARVAAGEREQLSTLQKVVSAEPVLSAAITGLVRDVADHYAGSFADVVRTAVPPRHRATELADVGPRPEPSLAAGQRVLPTYPGADSFLQALAAGRPRAAWTVLPSPTEPGRWAAGFAEAAAIVLGAGRGVLLLAPDARQLAALETECTATFGAGSFATLAADAGPSARYRNFLAVSRGHVRLVLGTRAAIFAPVANLGLVALWDDGNDAWAEPHAPYWHAREVAALRAHREGSALLLAAHNRTAEVQQFVERGWLAPLELTPDRARRLSAAVRPVAGPTSRDPLAAVARIPRDAFAVIRTGLAAGPVLIQVPRAGYLPVLVCASCREPARCPRCGQGLAETRGAAPACRVCGPVTGGWRCPECGGRSLRTPVVGVSRTAEELGKAFPGTPVVQASAEKPIARVPGEPALVLATPGAAPEAAGGFAAAVLLDAELMLSRPDLRAGEESLRRWLAVVARVRPAEEGGTVLVVGRAGLREVQALLRLDPVGYAATELAQRSQAGFPPAAKLVAVEGTHADLDAFVAAAEVPDGVVVTGPFPVSASAGEQESRLTLRAPLALGPALVAAVRVVQGQRAARKEQPLRVRVDPVALA